MILSDTDILREMELGNIVCTPFDRNNLSNSSIDLRLGQYISEQNGIYHTVRFDTDASGKLRVINPVKPKIHNLLNPKVRDSHKFVLKPGQCILAQTLELVGNPGDRIVSQILDKSTLARLHLSVCYSAGMIDVGNVLSVTLEIKNNSKNAIELQYGMHVAQIQFQYLNSPCINKYNGKYLNLLSTTAAK